MVRKSSIAALSVALAVFWVAEANAAVSVTDQGTVRKQQQKAAGGGKNHHGTPGAGTNATGSVSLIDAGGLKYFINTNITFNTTSSASGAMSEASYQGPHQVTTMNGGNVASTLNDAFDGYNTMCVIVNNIGASCATGNANFVIYNINGAAAADNTCQEGTPLAARQYNFPVKTSGALQMSRKVYVPAADTFARWLNYFTNTGATPLTVTMGVSNNLGSDSNTIITGSSLGGTPPTSITSPAGVTWIGSFQNWSGTTSSDPREGHVLQQTGATVPLAFVNFVNLNDNPYWGYTFTLAPGQTRIIANYVTAQNSKAVAASVATALAAGTNVNQFNCMTQTEKTSLANFSAASPLPPALAQIPTLTNTYLALLAAMLAAVTGFILYRGRSGR